MGPASQLARVAGAVRVVSGDAPAAQPQAVLAELTSAAIFLTLGLAPGGEDTARDTLADLAGLVRSVGFRRPGDRLSCVVGIGSEAYGRLFGGPRPAGLHPFVELDGPRHRAPSTGGDLMFHLRAMSMDLCFELADTLLKRLDGQVSVLDEVHGFKYFDQRDLMGFVDGTENPSGADATNAALIGAEDADFAGGSYVIVQKYLHDLRTWDALPVAEQERVVGRTKLSNMELGDDVKPSNSHVALNTITDADGTERQILRDNMPFGRMDSGERGTYFIGYAATPEVTEQMLRNMFLGDPPGNTDRILDFSTAVTGALFFVPSADFLDDPPPAPTAAPAAPADAPESSSPVDEGSLRIGSLKRSSTP